METFSSIRPLLAVLVPLAAVVLIGFSKRSPNIREFWTLLAALIEIPLVGTLGYDVFKGNTVVYTLGTIFPGFTFSFRVDGLGIVFAMTASILWLLTSFYSIGYMRSLKEHAQTRFYIAFAIAIASTMGIAFSANLFTLFAFYEILTLCTYPLVIHNQTQEALNAGKRYLTYLLGTSVGFLLLAIFLIFHTAGTLEFSDGGILAGKGSPILLTLIFFLFIAGTTKAALIPLHSWLPAAMVAPTPVSALLHAVAVVKAGVFTLLRIILDIFGLDLMDVLGLDTILIFLASVTIIVASMVALRQDNLKLRLAYSTISQLAYIPLGVALLTPEGITGGVAHIVAHAFGKITLFFCAGAIYVAAHKTQVSQLAGIGKQMPLTMGAFGIGAFSMIGIPLTGGFVSKWYLLMGAIEAEKTLVLLVLVVSTLLNAAYFLPIIYEAFWKDLPQGESSTVREAPAWMVVPILFTAAGSILLFFVPSYFSDLTQFILGRV